MDASENIQKLEIPDLNLLTRAMGDVHAQGNPHYMTDPENAKIVANDIAERLAKLDGDNAETYRANAKQFGAEIDRRMAGWKEQLAPLDGSNIVTYHKSWIYFAERFGMHIVAELEPKPGVPPTPSHLVNVVESVKGENVKLLLQEPWYSQKAAKWVADRAPVAIVTAPITVGGDDAAKDYFSLIDLIVDRLAKGIASNG